VAAGKTFGGYLTTRRLYATCRPGKPLQIMVWHRGDGCLGWFGKFFLTWGMLEPLALIESLMAGMAQSVDPLCSDCGRPDPWSNWPLTHPILGSTFYWLDLVTYTIGVIIGAVLYMPWLSIFSSRHLRPATRLRASPEPTIKCKRVAKAHLSCQTSGSK
jgi:hypothetical protein